MEIIIQETKQAAADVAARLIAKLITDKPDCILGLATGSTPLPLYQRLIGMKLDWSKVTAFNLDEYIGLPRDHSQTYHTFMWENLFCHVITMGIGTIMEARTNLLLAYGENKAQAIAEAIEGPVTSINPASVLQMHPIVKVCIDAPAASELSRIGYYRRVYDNKPEWQKI